MTGHRSELKSIKKKLGKANSRICNLEKATNEREKDINGDNLIHTRNAFKS